MKLLPIYSSQFKRDLKLCSKRGYNLNLFKIASEILIKAEMLPEVYKDHILIDNYRGNRECHIMPDWLLIYKTDAEYIYFVRTGTHSDLF